MQQNEEKTSDGVTTLPDKGFEYEIITLAVSRGITGTDWITHLKDVTECGKSLLRSVQFVPTSGRKVTLAILRTRYVGDADRKTEALLFEAQKHGWQRPVPEDLCLLRSQLSDDEFKARGLYSVVALHIPIPDFEGELRFLQINQFDGIKHTVACIHTQHGYWDRHCAFIFQVPPEAQLH